METLDLGPHPPTRGVVPQPRERPGLGEAATAVCSQCEEANVSSPTPKNNDKNGQKIWEKWWKNVYFKALWKSYQPEIYMSMKCVFQGSFFGWSNQGLWDPLKPKGQKNLESKAATYTERTHPVHETKICISSGFYPGFTQESLHQKK